MKINILTIIAVLCCFYQPVYSENLSGNTTSRDTIARLEKKLEKHLGDIQIQILAEKLILDSLQKEIGRLTNDQNVLKKTKNKEATIRKELLFNYQKQNAYRSLLTIAHQLKIQQEQIAHKQLKEIDDAIKELDKNKLPDLDTPPLFSTMPYLRDNTHVYDKEIFSPCNLTRSPDGKIIANEFENFFTYTDPKLANYFKESDFLECSARFIKTNKEYFLELKFILNSPKASSVYGTIDASTPSKIDFINGEFIYLNTYSVSSGILDVERGSTIYNVQFKLDREDIKNIQKQEVDTLTIIWTSGADRFEICKIDLLRTMFECIQKRKLQN